MAGVRDELRREFAVCRMLPVCGILLVAGCAGPGIDDGTIGSALHLRTGFSTPTNVAARTVAADAVLRPPGVNEADGLNEDELVALALWNNASFAEAMADLGLARADWVQAGKLPNPTVTMLLPNAPKILELTARLPIDALWLAPQRQRAAAFDLERVAETLVQQGLDLIRDVRAASVELALARARVACGTESAGALERMAALASTQLAGGEASELETVNVCNAALRAREELAIAERDAAVAEERLRHLAGMTFVKFRLDPGPLEAPTGELSPVEALLRDALASRPDYRAAQLAVEAAAKRAGLARVEIISLTGIFDSNNVGPLFEPGPGFDLMVPLFDQGQGRLSRRRAELDKAVRHCAAVRHRIALEVRESRLREEQASSEVRAWRERLLPQLEAGQRLAGQAAKAGATSFVPVHEAERALAEARLREATALAAWRRARAELERSIGHRLGQNPPERGKTS
ncbi:MAG TPA: TolC family protein [Verrucomicrobiae bacterium]|nr:TolC family protein [Verrucomicrobiae bacterium]